MSQYENQSIIAAKEKRKLDRIKRDKIARRAAHIVTVITIKGKQKTVCSCGAQSTLGNPKVTHKQFLT